MSSAAKAWRGESPRPRLDIFQAVIAKNAFAQTLERDVVVAFVVFDLALEHDGTNGKNVASPVVKKTVFRGGIRSTLL